MAAAAGVRMVEGGADERLVLVALLLEGLAKWATREKA